MKYLLALMAGGVCVGCALAAPTPRPASPDPCGRPRVGITLDLYAVTGGVITSVMRGSNAETAGLKMGDVIVKVGDVKCRGHDDVVSAFKMYRPGATIMVTVNRAGVQAMTFPVTAGNADNP